MLVFDSTPLIYLATVDRIELLSELAHESVLPASVYEEVVAMGIDRGHPDARYVDRAVEEGFLVVEPDPETDTMRRLRTNPKLAEADAAVISLAATGDAIAVMDEQYGRSVAETEGVVTRGTAWIVLSSVQAGQLAPREAKEVIDGMIDAGWYCSTDVYTRIVRRLESMD